MRSRVGWPKIFTIQGFDWQFACKQHVFVNVFWGGLGEVHHLHHFEMRIGVTQSWPKSPKKVTTIYQNPKRYLDPPRGAKWMGVGVPLSNPLGFLTPAIGGCWYACFSKYTRYICFFLYVLPFAPPLLLQIQKVHWFNALGNERSNMIFEGLCGLISRALWLDLGPKFATLDAIPPKQFTPPEI